MRTVYLCVAVTAFALPPMPAHAANEKITAPEAMTRTYAQNYKDMVLASCLTQAYRNDAGVSTDAGSSLNALRDWSYFDMEKSPDAVKSLIDHYLARDYGNPIVESEIKGVRFDFLKCMDLYHSKALEDLVKRLVISPRRSYKQR